PAYPVVEAHLRATVIAQDHAPVVVRVDPQVVGVAVLDGDRLEGLAAVDRAPHVDVQDVDGVGVLRVGIDVVVVPGALAQVAVLAAARPGFPVVVRAEHRAVLGLDDGPNPARLRARGSHADLADDLTLRQAGVAGDLLPGIAAVGGSPETGVLAARREEVRAAPGFPDRGVEDARVGRVHRQVDRAGLAALVQHQLPGLAAVFRAVDAALRVVAPDMAERRDVDQIG